MLPGVRGIGTLRKIPDGGNFMGLPENTKPIGWRSKIGVIVPPSNTVNEAEFNRVVVTSLRSKLTVFEKRLPFVPGRIAIDPTNNVLIITSQPKTWNAMAAGYIHDLNKD